MSNDEQPQKKRGLSPLLFIFIIIGFSAYVSISSYKERKAKEDAPPVAEAVR